MKLNPVEFMGLLKIMCVDGWVRGCPRVGGSLLGNQENKVPSSSPLEPATQAQEAEEDWIEMDEHNGLRDGFTSKLQMREPMNLQNEEISIEENDAIRALKVDSASKTSNQKADLETHKPMTLESCNLTIKKIESIHALGINDTNKTSNQKTDSDCAGSIKMEHETKSKSKSHRTARPLEEMLSEVIDTYLTLGRKQRQEIAVLLYQVTEEKEKKTQK